MLAYKIALHRTAEHRVLVTLTIPPEARTNMLRASVKEAKTAKYRTDCATVLRLEDCETGEELTEAVSYFYRGKPLLYKKGDLLTVPSYTEDPDAICAQGIHYFLDRDVALQFGLQSLDDGVLREWYPNGALQSEIPFLHGERHGLIRKWYEDGTLSYEAPYSHGSVDGLEQGWFQSGQLESQHPYVRGKIEGLSQEWYRSGRLMVQAQYVEGRLHGVNRVWYQDGTLAAEGHHCHGKREGLAQRWYPNGKLETKATYREDRREGELHEWQPDGTRGWNSLRRISP